MVKNLDGPTREQVIQWARDAGLTWDMWRNDFKVPFDVSTDQVTMQFAALAYAAGQEAEREECAKVCMSLCRVIEEPHEFERCAEAIRARGNNGQ